MRVKIYQINSNRDKAHFRFSNLAETTKLMQGNGILKKFIQNLILRGIRSIEVTRFLYPT